ncbi:MAG: hypothetical protein CSA50_03090 [Gammaproteobacteria bacterium]|nr:MAG: hypothetical protein CSA50_03090 [Gammaproteobacteria bacterium]
MASRKKLDLHLPTSRKCFGQVRIWLFLVLLAGCQPIALRSGGQIAEPCPEPDKQAPIIHKELKIVERKVLSSSSIILSMRKRQCRRVAPVPVLDGNPDSNTKTVKRTVEQVSPLSASIVRKYLKSAPYELRRIPVDDLTKLLVSSCFIAESPEKFLKRYTQMAESNKLDADTVLVLDLLARFGKRVLQLEKQKEGIRQELQLKIDALSAIEKEINAR